MASFTTGGKRARVALYSSQEKTMKNVFMEFRFGPTDTNLGREEFRARFKREFQKPLMDLNQYWSYQLAVTLGEIVKNFYDHANRRGAIIVSVTNNRVEWFAYDNGPGDETARTIDELIAEAMKNREKYKNSAPDVNCGLGLGMIKAGLDGLKKCEGVLDSTWDLSTFRKFEYRGTISLT